MDQSVCIQREDYDTVLECLSWAQECGNEGRQPMLDGADVCNHRESMRSRISGMEKERARA